MHTQLTNQRPSADGVVQMNGWGSLPLVCCGNVFSTQDVDFGAAKTARAGVPYTTPSTLC